MRAVGRLYSWVWPVQELSFSWRFFSWLVYSSAGTFLWFGVKQVVYLSNWPKKFAVDVVALEVVRQKAIFSVRQKIP